MTDGQRELNSGVCETELCEEGEPRGRKGHLHTTKLGPSSRPQQGKGSSVYISDASKDLNPTPPGAEDL